MEWKQVMREFWARLQEVCVTCMAGTCGYGKLLAGRWYDPSASHLGSSGSGIPGLLHQDCPHCMGLYQA
jgi:hypothetical protein